MKEIMIISTIRREKWRLRKFGFSQIHLLAAQKSQVGLTSSKGYLYSVLLCITYSEPSLFAYKQRYFLNTISSNKIKLLLCYPNEVTLQNPCYKGNKTLKSLKH